MSAFAPWRQSSDEGSCGSFGARLGSGCRPCPDSTSTVKQHVPASPSKVFDKQSKSLSNPDPWVSFFTFSAMKCQVCVMHFYRDPECTRVLRKSTVWLSRKPSCLFFSWDTSLTQRSSQRQTGFRLLCENSNFGKIWACLSLTTFQMRPPLPPSDINKYDF